MKRHRFLFVTLLIGVISGTTRAQHSYLSHLHATKDSPLYTTYAAALQRSEFTLDVGYHFIFYDSTDGLNFRNQKGGDWSIAFAAPLSKSGTDKYVYRLNEIYRQPVITASYSDIVKYTYYPFENLRVDVTFLVYNSHASVQEFVLHNLSREKQNLRLVPFLKKRGGVFCDVQTQKKQHSMTFTYFDRPDGWMVEHQMPHVDTVANLFLASFDPDSTATSLNNLPWEPGETHSDFAYSIAFYKQVELPVGASYRFRIVRTVGGGGKSLERMISISKKLLTLNLASVLRNDERIYSKISRLHFRGADLEMLYWSGFTLLRQVMMPPEGKCHYNYYVFSREPQWGWGHGGQVFHESLSMLAYVFMDPKSAMNSQRVYMERQHADGYINYRTGPYLDETIPYNNQLTTSAPWFNWENWEIYKVTKDRSFLSQAYFSGKNFYNYWLRNRDSLHDGLCEWGGHAVLESVRDGDVAVWDQVGWPSNFEGPDLNSMLVEEAKALESMANALGKTREAEQWKAEAQERAELMNKYMWDVKTSFYYNVDMKSKTFSFKKKDDLKRQEIIGFLPLWAGVATRQQADSLVRVLTDTFKFWRKFGVPSLSADDSYYNPTGYWNGPVWVEWNFLIEQGLLKYGYKDLAKELVRKVAAGMIAQLKKDHQLWEFYNPDRKWAGYHTAYIWAGLISRMLMDLKK